MFIYVTEEVNRVMETYIIVYMEV